MDEAESTKNAKTATGFAGIALAAFRPPITRHCAHRIPFQPRSCHLVFYDCATRIDRPCTEPRESSGQVYVPFINITLFCLTVLLICTFKKSGNLASAYGIAVATTMLITTALICIIARTLWPKIPRAVLIPLFAIFLAGMAQSTPWAMFHNFKHNQVLHERIIVLSVLSEEIPTVAPENRSTVVDVGKGIYRVYCRFGFMETPDVPSVLRTLTIAGETIDPMQVSYFLGKEMLVMSRSITLWNWWKRLFIFMSRNATTASSFFKLPPNRVVEFGAQMEF
jgi:K+ transporter